MRRGGGAAAVAAVALLAAGCGGAGQQPAPGARDTVSSAPERAATHDARTGPGARAAPLPDHTAQSGATQRAAPGGSAGSSGSADDSTGGHGSAGGSSGGNSGGGNSGGGNPGSNSGSNGRSSGSEADDPGSRSSRSGHSGRDDPGGRETTPGDSPRKESPGAGPAKPGDSAGSDDTSGDAGKQPEMLEYGDRGPQVRALQRTLKRLHYDVGEVDGVFGATTRYALWAFQKVNRLQPDGVVGPQTRAALADPETPKPLEPGGGSDRVEIDLSEQLLYVYDDGHLALISHISSGSENSYCTEDGHCGDAVTPSGVFEAAWRVNGWRESNLGRLYNPVYFAAGGFAVHGSPSVPLYPASHGCVRIPMHTATIFPDLVEPGEPFYVY